MIGKIFVCDLIDAVKELSIKRNAMKNELTNLMFFFMLRQVRLATTMDTALRPLSRPP